MHGLPIKLFHRHILEEIRPHYHSSDILVIHSAPHVGKTCLMRLIREELEAAGKKIHYIDLEDLRLPEVH